MNLQSSDEAFQILLDCGSSKILTECDPRKVKAIFITHTHLDHIKYLPKFIRSLKASKRTEVLYIFLHSEALSVISSFVHFPFLQIPSFVKFMPLNPGASFMFGEIKIDAVAANHPAHSLAYKFTFQTKQAKEGKNTMEICFCPDTSAYSDELIPFFKDADYGLIDTTFDDIGLQKYFKRRAPITHCSPKFSGTLMKQAGVKTYVAVHYFWKRFGKIYSEAIENLRASIYEYFRGDIIITEDLKPIQLL